MARPLPAHALFTMAEVKEAVRAQGTGQHELLALIAAWVADDLEQYTDRRLVYRAPGEDPDNDNIVASAALSNGALTIAAQPNSAGRTLIYSVQDDDFSVTAGLITSTGTFNGVPDATEVVDLSKGLVQHGTKFCSALSSVEVSALAGQGGTDKVKVGSSKGYTEYHSPDGRTRDLWPIEWPIRSVLEVNEDADRLYESATGLAENTDFLVAERQRLVRLSGGDLSAWHQGFRAVRHVYAGGYSPGDVPARVKGVALRLAALYYTELTKGRVELASGSSALGNWTRFGPAGLSDEMKRDLTPFRRTGHFEDVERDLDLEAA